MADEVPNEATLVRFFMPGEYDTYNGEVIPSFNVLGDPKLSVDWLERTTLQEGYSRKAKSEAHACFTAKAARDLEQIVEHAPTDKNDAHCLVICPEALRENNKRKVALRGLLYKAMTSSGLRAAV